MRKRGEIVTENAIGLILAVAATIALILLLVGLYGDSFNKGEEGAESYFDSLKGAIREADEEGRSSFFMLDLDDDELEFYLVYFGEAVSFAEENKEREKALIFMEDDKDFVRSPRDGALCICYWQNERTLCDDCMDLKGAVSYSEKSEAPWVIREGEYVQINKDGENYVFARD